MSSWRAGCGGTRTSGSGERVGETVAREGGDAPRLDSHAWLATRTDKSTIKRMLRIDWDTVGRIVKRVCDAELDPSRLRDLYDIGIDEVSWKRQHKYLTLVVDHQRRQVVWGCEGSGQAAADAFFSELDPPPQNVAAPEHAKQPPELPEPAIMVPFGPCPTVPAGLGIPDAWLAPGLELEPVIFARAGLLRAVSMDMAPGYAKSVREHAPQAIVCIDPYHVVQLANQALDEVRRAYWNELRSLGDQDAAKRFKDSRWCLLKKPDKLTDEQATTLTPIKAAGGEVWRAYTLKEAVRGIFEPGLSIEDVEVLIKRLLSRLARNRLELCPRVVDLDRLGLSDPAGRVWCPCQGRVRRIPWSSVVRRSSWCVRAARSRMSRSRSGSRIRRCVTGAGRSRSIRVAVRV